MKIGCMHVHLKRRCQTRCLISITFGYTQINHKLCHWKIGLEDQYSGKYGETIGLSYSIFTEKQLASTIPMCDARGVPFLITCVCQVYDGRIQWILEWFVQKVGYFIKEAYIDLTAVRVKEHAGLYETKVVRLQGPISDQTVSFLIFLEQQKSHSLSVTFKCSHLAICMPIRPDESYNLSFA